MFYFSWATPYPAHFSGAILSEKPEHSRLHSLSSFEVSWGDGMLFCLGHTLLAPLPFIGVHFLSIFFFRVASTFTFSWEQPVLHFPWKRGDNSIWLQPSSPVQSTLFIKLSLLISFCPLSKSLHFSAFIHLSLIFPSSLFLQGYSCRRLCSPSARDGLFSVGKGQVSCRKAAAVVCMTAFQLLATASILSFQLEMMRKNWHSLLAQSLLTFMVRDGNRTVKGNNSLHFSN